MSSEENRKKESVEEMAEKLAEGLTEEVPAEEPVEKQETLAEEPLAESDTPMEEPVQEPVQEEVLEEQPKKKRKGLWIAGIVAAAVLVVLGIGYVFVANHYSDRFLMKTYVNGKDCSGMTIKEVENLIQKQVEEYSLTIHGANESKEVIEGTDIDIKYIGYQQLKEAFQKQNEYLWPKALFSTNQITAEILFDYSQEKLDTMIAGLACVKPENQTVAVDATVVFKDGQFVVQDETYGTQVDTAKLTELVNTCVKTIDTELDLDSEGCYIQPRFKANSQEVISAKDVMNAYLDAEITHSLDGAEMTLTSSTFAAWISVNENMEPVISADKATAYAKTVASKYNTANRSGVLVTPTGKEVTMSNAVLGRAIGTDSERDQIISEIKAGKKVTRSPIVSRQAMADGQYAWGTTYIEVDISAQHMWYIVNGSIVFETDVVTGKRGSNDTPTGIYTILEKMRNKTLVGRIVNGKPLYRTPVSYWMRVTWSGIGFHDASWQPTFGGDRYVSNGSHGCINMPPAKAGELYNLISKGTNVVIHY